MEEHTISEFDAARVRKLMKRFMRTWRNESEQEKHDQVYRSFQEETVYTDHEMVPISADIWERLTILQKLRA